MLEEKIKALEIKFAHQDFLVDQLNKIVASQQQVIEKMQTDIQDLKLSLSENTSQPRSLEDDIPPHF